MKILILARDIPPYVCIPGATQRVVLFGYYLIKKGHEVAVIGSSRRVNVYNKKIIKRNLRNRILNKIIWSL